VIRALEAAIVTRLLSWPALADFAVEAWPERISEYRFTSPTGAVLVAYKGSRYGKPFSADVVAQERDLEFELHLLVRNLRDHSGGYEVLDEIRKALTGWVAPGASSGAYIIREGFSTEENGVWEFASHICIPTVSVQAEPPTTDAPILGGGEIEGAMPVIGGRLKDTTFYPEFPK
jgi:hypothetical protein